MVKVRFLIIKFLSVCRTIDEGLLPKGLKSFIIIDKSDSQMPHKRTPYRLILKLTEIVVSVDIMYLSKISGNLFSLNFAYVVGLDVGYTVGFEVGLVGSRVGCPVGEVGLNVGIEEG